MANYTTESYGKHIEQNLNKFINSNAGFQEAIFKLVSMSEKRIFDKGKDGNGKDIGTYSTSTMLATKSQFRNASAFQPTLKQSSVSFSTNINTRKTKTKKSKTDKNDPSNWLWIKFKKAKKAVPVMILDGGYAEFKKLNKMAQLGNRVNLQLNKNFRRAFLTKSFPITHNATEVIAQMGIPPSEANPIGKIVGLMNKYPNAFKFTKAERKFIIDELRNLFIQSLRA